MGIPLSLFLFEWGENNMKKNSKSFGKDYSKLDELSATDRFDYYGIILKDDRVKIDTKRYKKFFDIPNSKIELRHSVYYLPNKIHRKDYRCNWFRDLLSGYKNLWYSEYKQYIESIKTPKQVEDNARLDYITTGYLGIDEVSEKALIEGVKRIPRYKMIIKMLYAQFFHEFMSSIDAICLKLITSCGYNLDDYTKKQFDSFIQGLQGEKAVRFRSYDNYKYYNKPFTVWNFLKHNSIRSYNELKKEYPEMIWDPNNSYKNGDSALTVLKLDEKYLIEVLDTMHYFFDELCNRTFNENIEDAQWDYDDYFYSIVKERIKEITNPLDI